MAYCPIFKGDCPEDSTKCTFWEKSYTVCHRLEDEGVIFPGRCGLIK